MAITAAQQKALTSLARAANRRLERATQGQRASLEKQIKTYHTREGAGGLKFSQGKAKTEAEYRQRMRELEKFMEAKTTTRRGWEQIKADNVSKAGETLRGQGYELTDKELAIILEELPKDASPADFYNAIEHVEAKKQDQGDKWRGTRAAISAALKERVNAQEAVERILKKRLRSNG